MGKQAQGKQRSRNDYNTDYEDRKESFHKMGMEKLSILKITPRSIKQAEAIRQLQDNDVSFMFGPAGTAKTFLSAYMSLEWLKTGKYEKVILSRPSVETGGTLGFLPGSLDEKIGPYMVPIIQNMKKICGCEDQVDQMQSQKIIEYLPFQMMRGYTFDNVIVVLDECQNCTKEQMKLALTRIGDNCKVLCTMDGSQCDLEDQYESCIVDMPKFKDVPGIGFIEFTNRDIVRSPMCKLIVKCYDRK